jgi:formiminoglutamate deiminase
VTSYFAEVAWVTGQAARDVRITVEDGRFTEVAVQAQARPADIALSGLVLPGFANTHSHAFHRALRGRTHDGGGTFWTWRERMYAVADRLDPDSYLALARATFAEMALAGITGVGEFHYLHHAPGGHSYDDPNAMGKALIEAARQAGIRITLLDTCYLAGGLNADGHTALGPHQLRFGDGTAAAWAKRVSQFSDPTTGTSAGTSWGGLAAYARLGAAIHSVRAVPREQIPAVVEAASGRPLHVHLSEQPAENDLCGGYYGMTPTALLHEAGALGPDTTAVHATHLTDADIAILGSTATMASFCPTTERDLADGIGPARLLLEAGVQLVLGSDQHAIIDLLEEARALEMHERLASLERGRLPLCTLIDALTSAGQRSIGWQDAGRIEVGARADLVAVRLDSVRTAGSVAEQAILAATASDVATVIVDGKVIVRDGVHLLGDVGRQLADAIDPLWT